MPLHVEEAQPGAAESRAYLCLVPFLTKSSMSRMGLASSCSRLFSGDTRGSEHRLSGPLSPPGPQGSPGMEWFQATPREGTKPQASPEGALLCALEGSPTLRLSTNRRSGGGGRGQWEGAWGSAGVCSPGTSRHQLRGCLLCRPKAPPSSQPHPGLLAPPLLKVLPGEVRDAAGEGWSSRGAS